MNPNIVVYKFCSIEYFSLNKQDLYWKCNIKLLISSLNYQKESN